MRHLDELDSKFGKSRVLGGQCVIAATLNKERAILQPAPAHATGCRGRTKFTQAPRSARTATPALRSGEVGEPASSPGRPALPVV